LDSVAAPPCAGNSERLLFTTPKAPTGIPKLKVLLAEDDVMIADMNEEILIAAGYEVCGIARTVTEAIALGRLHSPDLAVLDLRLADGGLGTEVAAQLHTHGKIGILFATGNKSFVTLTSADGEACLSKPYRNSDLIISLRIVDEILAFGKTSRTLPRGLAILACADSCAPEAMVG
jgi:CheY-like chemotaxis protein